MQTHNDPPANTTPSLRATMSSATTAFTSSLETTTGTTPTPEKKTSPETTSPILPPGRRERELLGRWESQLQPLNIPTDTITKWFAIIVQRYSEPQRHYHTLSHVYNLFTLFDEYLDLIKDPLVCALSIWFHDVIYDPTRKDNEDESVKLYEEFAAEINQDASVEAQVRHYIACTKAHFSTDASNDPDLGLFLDFDLSILGNAEEAYDEYAQQIRQEYSHYSDEAYKKGRTTVLQSFVRSTPLFKTAILRDRFEQKAIDNLEREIKNLNS